MIRFAWYQFRPQAAVAFGPLAVIAVILAATGPHLVHLYDTAVGPCAVRDDCPAAVAAFIDTDSTLQSAVKLVITVLPYLIGVFWGAPLAARELETGTFRLAWTQGITRTRWLAVKLGVVGLASLLLAGLLSLALTWWYSPIDRASGYPWGEFAQRDIAPVGYAAFAFALGVTAGLLIRRTVPAMAATLAVLVAVQFAFPLWVRSHLIAPVQTSVPLNAASITGVGVVASDGRFWQVMASVHLPGGWIYSSYVTTSAGLPLSTEPATQACGGDSSYRACLAHIATLHLRQVVTYQPASRYWAFQWYETAIYLAVAILLAGFCAWWIRRRRSAGFTIRRQYTSPRAPVLRALAGQGAGPRAPREPG